MCVVVFTLSKDAAQQCRERQVFFCTRLRSAKAQNIVRQVRQLVGVCPLLFEICGQIGRMRNAGYTDVERGERGSTEEHLTVTQFKVQREQERLDSLTAQADQKAQSLAKTSQTLSKKEKELAAVQKKATLTKEALIHARDLDYIGKRTFLGNYSLTEEEFSKLKKQADHGYMMDVENRRLKEELSTAKKEAIHWSNKYHNLWYDVKPYLDALHRAPELVRGFLEKILAPKQERTMNVPQRNRKRGQDVEL